MSWELTRGAQQCPLVPLSDDSLEMDSALQGGAPLTQPLVEEDGDDLYKDLYDDLSVSTVTAGPNVTDYEVSRMQMQTETMWTPRNRKSFGHLQNESSLFSSSLSCADSGV